MQRVRFSEAARMRALMSISEAHQQYKMTTRSLKWTILKITLAIVLIGFIVTRTTFSDLYTLWNRISVPWMLCSILAFFAIICSMARRYWLLIDRKITFRQTITLVIIQTVIGNLFATS